MKIDDKTKTTIQYYREVAKISALSWCKTDKDKYLTDDEILPFDQSRIIEQAKIIYFPLEKTLEKQVKAI